MGGLGSGLATGWSNRTVIEETKRIDIRFMRKKGFLKAGLSGKLSWSVGDQPNGEINFRCFDSHLQLSYRYRYDGEDWQPVEQRICFDRTPCHYGGERLWFRCPQCSYRVAVLCSDGPLFLCRLCYGLPYRSQQEGLMDRLISKKHKLGEQIFENYNNGYGWRKKKGMHQKTFDRLYQEYINLEEQWSIIFERYVYLV